MKKFLLLLIIPFLSFGQDLFTIPISEKTGKACYENVIHIDSVSKADLYILAYQWFAETFNSPDDVIKMQDKEGGVIISRGIIPAFRKPNRESGHINFSMSFFAKEGRYKYVITDISHYSQPGERKTLGGAIENEVPECGYLIRPKKQWKYLQEQAHIQFKNLEISLKNYIANNLDEEDDW